MRIIKSCWGLTVLKKIGEKERELLSYNVENLPALYASREKARGDARTLEKSLEPRPHKVYVVAYNV